MDRIQGDLPDYEIVADPPLPAFENEIFGSLYVDSMTNKKYINVFFRKK